MKVVGITTQQEFYIGSKERNFRINELLVIEDSAQGRLIGEVVEARTFNRYIPLNIYGDFVDSSVLESLRSLGYNVDEDTIYIAKMRLIQEALYPVLTGSEARVPDFSEVEGLLIKSQPNEGLVLGGIRNTDDVAKGMPDELKDLFDTFEDGEFISQADVPYIMDIRAMHQYPHIGVFGGSGSGKSFGLRVLLEELMKKSIPCIVLDPHFEMDFANVIDLKHSQGDYEDNYLKLQVGQDVGINFKDLNAGELKHLLEAASPISDSMNNVVDLLFKPKDTYEAFSTRIKLLMEAQDEGSLEKLDARISEAENAEEREAWKSRKNLFIKYDKTVHQNSARGILWRLNRLFHDGVFSKDSAPIEAALNDGRLAVIQGSTRILQVYSTYILNNVYRRRRDYKDALLKKEVREYFPPFILVTDEAHTFAPKGIDSPSKAIIKEIAQEGRKYGVFLALATQRPTLLDETVTAQLNTKLIFRTVRASDIETIKEETDITYEESKRLPYLRTGDVFISSAVMGRTSFARIRAAHTEGPHSLNPFEELKKKSEESLDELFEMFKSKLPALDSDFLGLAAELEKETGNTFSVKRIEDKLNLLAKNDLISKEKTFLGYKYTIKE